MKVEVLAGHIFGLFEEEVQLPVTLRDVRRAFNVKCESPRISTIRILGKAAISQLLRLEIEPHHFLPPREIDRAISKFGADFEIDAYLREREIATRTNHIVASHKVVESPIGVENADAHGGDGNSGEIEHIAETFANRQGGEQQQANDTPHVPSGDSGAVADSSSTGGGQAGSQDAAKYGDSPTGQGESGGDELTAGMGTQPRHEAADSDKSTMGSRVPATVAGAPVFVDDTELADKAEDGEAGTPASALSNNDIEGLSKTVSQTRERVAAKKAAMLLRRIIGEEVGAFGKRSPRVDARALMRELVSKRYAIHRALKHEMEPKELVILVDYSPSCSEVIEAFLSLALDISSEFGKVSVIAHSNGREIVTTRIMEDWARHIVKAHEKDMRADYFSRRHGKAAERVWEEVAKHKPALILALGDHDADWALNILRETTKIIAVHHHDIYERFGIPNVQRIGGVKDAISAAESLERFLKRRGQ